MDSKWEHKIARENIDNGSCVLDVGCGFGKFLSEIMSKLNVNVIGLELSESDVK